MKKKLICVFFLLFALIFQISAAAKVTSLPDISYFPSVTVSYTLDGQNVIDGTPDTGCKAVFVADPDTGKIYYEKNAYAKMYPASTTKILTALLVIENCSLSETAQVSKRALDLVPSGYSNAKMCDGEVFDIETLLYALLIPSANEAANVLAEYVGGSVEAFAEMCNARAKELGCENLHFVNPNGVHNEDHYCSAYDLYLIAKECFKHEIFRKIVSTKSFSLPATDIYRENDRFFYNTNELLQRGTYYYEYCTGIKTGRTNPAGECLVGAASKNGLDIISVVLGGKSENSRGLNDRFYDTKNLFEFVYKNYSEKTIAQNGDSFFTADVFDATEDTRSLDLVIACDVAALVPDSLNAEDIAFSISLKKEIAAPIYKGQILGEITFYADGAVCKTDLIAAHGVKQKNRKHNRLLFETDYLMQ
jgi:D-alanyl-D-alanine carboxypeptidase (penicillin-binding protein 5/6)